MKIARREVDLRPEMLRDWFIRGLLVSGQYIDVPPSEPEVDRELVGGDDEVRIKIQSRSFAIAIDMLVNTPDDASLSTFAITPVTEMTERGERIRGSNVAVNTSAEPATDPIDVLVEVVDAGIRCALEPYKDMFKEIEHDVMSGPQLS